MNILDYLNEQSSNVFIEHVDPQTGSIKLSNQSHFNINEVSKLSDIGSFIVLDIDN